MAKDDARAERLAAALRENLRRRKARARAIGGAPEVDDEREAKDVVVSQPE